MRKVAIIGMGHVGSTVAYTLFTRNLVDELVLFDTNEKKCSAEFGDLRDSLARNKSYIKVKEGSWNDLSDTDIIITSFATTDAEMQQKDRFAEFGLNSINAQKVGQKIKDSGFDGILINISNPCDAITTILQKVTDLPKNHVFGTGTNLDTARMQRIVGEELNQDPKNVSGFVLGEHGAAQFTAWSTVYVNGKSSLNIFDKEKRDYLSTLPDINSFKVAGGKGYTCYAIASCAAELIEDIFSDSKSYVPVSLYLEEVGTYLGYPAIIGKDGVEKIYTLDLPQEEHEKLISAANKLKDKLKQVKNAD